MSHNKNNATQARLLELTSISKPFIRIPNVNGSLNTDSLLLSLSMMLCRLEATLFRDTLHLQGRVAC